MASEPDRQVSILKASRRELRLSIALKTLLTWFYGLSFNSQMRLRPYMWRNMKDILAETDAERAAELDTFERAGIK